jgi:uncharacterized protein (DUF2062 family)/2-polyprenyl-3-methyl-5-hydroxy-6-metoxy-1,4-benzoquinol methylase
VRRQSLALRLRRLFLILWTEGEGPGRESAAIGLGVFIGCLPAYGFHLLACTVAGTVFRLNRLKMYLAANISNPFFAPWLILVELQVGAWLRRGSFHPLTIETARTASVTGLGADFLLGALAVGAGLGVIAGGTTYAVLRRTAGDDAFAALVRRASDRYVNRGVVAWEFARRKLTSDPVYKDVVCGGLLTGRRVPQSSGDVARSADAGRTLLDVGCGMGLTLALVAEAARADEAGTWPASWPAPPRFDRLIGIELRRRVAAVASAALGSDAQVIAGDALTSIPARFDAVVLFDVLQMMRRDEQDALIAALTSALDPRGMMLIREADATAGWRFTAVRWGNRLKALAFGSWRQQFHYRSASEWPASLGRHGLRVDVRGMSTGTPFANVLFVATPGQSPAGVINSAGSTRTDATASATTLITDTRPIDASGG